jgi:hypothetical protein
MQCGQRRVGEVTPGALEKQFPELLLTTTGFGLASA